MVANEKTEKQKLIDQVLVLLSNNLVEIDLSINDLTTSLDIALQRYRQRSSNATQEGVFFLTLQPEVQTYTLPKEIIEVSKIYRQGLGANSGQTNGNQYDPFSLAYTNLYLLQPTGQGDLATFYYYSSWLETAGKLFGATYDFRWDSRTSRLTIIRHQIVTEDVGIVAYMDVSDDLLISGRYSGPWIRNYTLALCKMILGNAYEKFAGIPGPQGQISLNGAQLKAEAVAEMAALEVEINTYQDGGTPLPFIYG